MEKADPQCTAGARPLAANRRDTGWFCVLGAGM